MNVPDQRLADRAADIEQASRGIISWVERNDSLVRQDKAGLLKDMRRFATTAGRMRVAAGRPMCVGVFGPSQNGKSHLIATLARKPGSDALLTRLGDQTVDFITEINPEGGRESTGLVTRFSLRHFEVPSPREKPVCVRLLSQCDIVKIIGNCYFSDLIPTEKKPPTQEEIETTVQTLSRSARASAVDPLIADDIFDLQVYFEQNFLDNPQVYELRKSYWNLIADLAPRLRIAERAQLFGLIWGGQPKLTSLYEHLCGVLESLAFGQYTFAGFDALSPRGASIIDVETLSGVAGKEAEDPNKDVNSPEERAKTTPLTLVNVLGHEATVARCDLAAVVAELHLQITEKPHEFFEHTDLLDFPGARSRDRIKGDGMITEYLSDPKNVRNLFLRGKVAYLFDRYCAEQELTSLLLCKHHEQGDVKSLPEVVDKWVSATHGDTPERRAAAQTSLFFILTFFDRMFQSKAGEASAEKKWANRLKVSLVDFFGAGRFDWPTKWDRKGPFKNCFWFRNTTVKSEDIFAYPDEKSYYELGILPEKQPAIARLKAGFLASPEATCHFDDPERAFDAGLELNDGGATYLAERLGPVCNPDLKRQQIQSQIERLRETILKRISPWFVSGDPEQQIEQRRMAARKVVESLAHSYEFSRADEFRRFGELLASMQVTEEDLEAIYYRIEMGGSAGDPDDIVAGRSPGEQAILNAVFGDSLPETRPKIRDTAQRFAERVLEAWFRDLHDLAANEAFCRLMLMPSSAVTDLVKEVVEGAKRHDLETGIAEIVRASTLMHMRAQNLVKLPVRRSAHLINSYINKLGYDLIDAKERPTAKDLSSPRPIFDTAPPPSGIPEISEKPADFDRRFYIDWMCAFVDLVERNARFDTGGGVDLDANRELGRYVAALA